MLKRSSIRFCSLVLRASLSTVLSGLPESIAHHPETWSWRQSLIENLGPLWSSVAVDMSRVSVAYGKIAFIILSKNILTSMFMRGRIGVDVVGQRCSLQWIFGVFACPESILASSGDKIHVFSSVLRPLFLGSADFSLTLELDPDLASQNIAFLRPW